mmetsp:Transcript_116266/g.333889  ORF Transcript_116266/g.333889 Transcript_116266/m.333889 type:complete len:272 (-) Transcript_116266:2457-3272(-)
MPALRGDDHAHVAEDLEMCPVHLLQPCCICAATDASLSQPPTAVLGGVFEGDAMPMPRFAAPTLRGARRTGFGEIVIGRLFARRMRRLQTQSLVLRAESPFLSGKVVVALGFGQQAHPNHRFEQPGLLDACGQRHRSANRSRPARRTTSKGEGFFTRCSHFVSTPLSITLLHLTPRLLELRLVFGAEPPRPRAFQPTPPEHCEPLLALLAQLSLEGFIAAILHKRYRGHAAILDGIQPSLLVEARSFRQDQHPQARGHDAILEHPRRLAGL